MRHTFRSSRVARLIAGLAVVLGAPAAFAQTSIGFEELGPSLSGGAAVANGYKGLNWTVVNPMGYITQGNTQYTDIVCRSGNNTNCGYNGFGGITGLTSAAPITLNGWIRRWNWNANAGSATSVLIEAVNSGGTVVGSQILALTGSYQAFSMSALFTTLRFTPTGGTGLQCSGPANCGYFLIDDLTVNPLNQNVVPEPSTYALLGTGLAGLLAVRSWRRRSAEV